MRCPAHSLLGNTFVCCYCNNSEPYDLLRPSSLNNVTGLLVAREVRLISMHTIALNGVQRISCDPIILYFHVAQRLRCRVEYVLPTWKYVLFGLPYDLHESMQIPRDRKSSDLNRSKLFDSHGCQNPGREAAHSKATVHHRFVRLYIVLHIAQSRTCTCTAIIVIRKALFVLPDYLSNSAVAIITLLLRVSDLHGSNHDMHVSYICRQCIVQGLFVRRSLRTASNVRCSLPLAILAWT
jgi:hypothetical protein